MIIIDNALQAQFSGISLDGDYRSRKYRSPENISIRIRTGALKWGSRVYFQDGREADIVPAGWNKFEMTSPWPGSKGRTFTAELELGAAASSRKVSQESVKDRHLQTWVF